MSLIDKQIPVDYDNRLAQAYHNDALKHPEVAEGFGRMQSIHALLCTVGESINMELFAIKDAMDDEQSRRFFFQSLARIDFLQEFMWQQFKRPFRASIKEQGIKGIKDDVSLGVEALNQEDLVSFFAQAADKFSLKSLEGFMQEEGNQKWIDQSITDRAIPNPGRLFQYGRNSHFIPKNDESIDPAEFSGDVSYGSLSGQDKAKVDAMMQIFYDAMSIIVITKDPILYNKGVDISWEDGEIVRSNIDIQDSVAMSVSAHLSGIVGKTTMSLRSPQGTPREIGTKIGFLACEVYQSCTQWADEWWADRQSQMKDPLAGEAVLLSN